MIEVADAREWLVGREGDLVLTDPPHLDCYTGPDEHLAFTREWLPVALEIGCPVIHSCGAERGELANYLQVSVPDVISVWQQPDAPTVVHFYLFHNLGARDRPSSVYVVPKPHPWYADWITWYTMPLDLVLDPFCGMGEVPFAAQHEGRRYAGCDVRPCVEECRRRGL